MIGRTTSVDETLIVIPSTARQEIKHYDWGDTKDIMRVIMLVVDKTELAGQVEKFSQQFKGNTAKAQYEQLKRLWEWVRNNITYKADGGKAQIIKHPARLYEDNMGDCKSFTVFIRFVLYNLEIPHIIRFISQTSSRRIDHVYPVAYLDGKEVVLDAVHNMFDNEVPATRVVDKKPKMTKIVEIAGVRKLGNKFQIRSNVRRNRAGIPVSSYIPFSSLTRGEAALLLQARQHEIKAAINAKNGYSDAADTHKRMYDVLTNEFSTSVSGKYVGGLDQQYRKKVEGVLKAARQDNAPALRVTKPQSAFIAGCEDGRFTLSSGQETSVQFLIKRQIGERPTGLLNNKEKSAWDALYAAEYERLAQPLIAEQVINCRLEQTGTSFTYYLWGNENYGSVVQNKFLFAEAWVNQVVAATGLDAALMYRILENGFIASTETNVGDAKGQLLPLVQANGSVNGISLDPATITLIVAIVSAAASVVGTIATLIAQLKSVKLSQSALSNVPVPGSFNPQRGDFLEESNTSSSNLLPLLLLGAGGALLLMNNGGKN